MIIWIESDRGLDGVNEDRNRPVNKALVLDRPVTGLDGCKRIATTEVKFDIEGLLKQKQCQISH
jgi:hypothetical protein